MRAGCASFAIFAGLLLPGAAGGQTRAPEREMLRLEWRAPAGCPSGRMVRDAALRSTAGAGGAPLDVHAEVEHGARWRVTIRTSRDGEVGETRSLEAASCGALAEATAAVLSVALIPGQALARSASSAPADGSAPATDLPPAAASAARSGATAPKDTAAAAVSTGGPREGAAARTSSEVAASVNADDGERAVTAARRDRRFAVAAELAGDAGMLPALAGGARVALAWTPRKFRLEVSGAYFSGQSRTDGLSSAGASFGLLTIGGRGCWAALHVGVELGPCGGIDVQHMTADGFGAPTNFEASGTWAAATLGGLVRIPLTRSLALRGDLDGVAPFTRPRFVVENDGAVHKPAGIGARAAIGAELNFL